MLFRYAENLARGAGIVWNVGEAPAVSDGATDLGFVLAIALLIKLGLSSVTAAVVLNLTAVAVLGAAFAAMNRLTWMLSPAHLAMVIAVVMSGPVNQYIAGGFSAPVFGALLFITASLAHLAALHPERTTVLALSAGTLAGLAGWWRPEGFALGPMVMMLAGLAAVQDMSPSQSWSLARRVAVSSSAPFLAVAGLWAWFRVGYFGNLLPTSFVMKSGGVHPMNVLQSLSTYLLLLAPLIGLVLGRKLIRTASAWRIFLLALGLASLIWLPIATTMNWWSRMQWPLVPVLVFLAIPLAQQGWEPLRHAWKPREVVSLMVAVVVSLAAFHGGDRGYFKAPFQSAVAAALSKVDTGAVRVATTEAGLIPLALKPTGQALDTWGHNQRSIAASGGTALGLRLKELEPNIVVTHGYRPPNGLPQGECAPTRDEWNAMVDALYSYADSHKLRVLRATETNPCEVWSIFIGDGLNPDVQQALLTYSMPGRELTINH